MFWNDKTFFRSEKPKQNSLGFHWSERNAELGNFLVWWKRPTITRLLRQCRRWCTTRNNDPIVDKREQSEETAHDWPQADIIMVEELYEGQEYPSSITANNATPWGYASDTEPICLGLQFLRRTWDSVRGSEVRQKRDKAYGGQNRPFVCDGAAKRRNVECGASCTRFLLPVPTKNRQVTTWNVNNREDTIRSDSKLLNSDKKRKGKIIC